MKKILLTNLLVLTFIGAFAQTAPIAPRYIRTDSITTFTDNEDLSLSGRGTGGVNIEGAYTLPKADGTAGQFMQTDGSGLVTFQSVSGFTVTNEGGNRVIVSTGPSTGNAVTGFTHDGTTLSSEGNVLFQRGGLDQLYIGSDSSVLMFQDTALSFTRSWLYSNISGAGIRHVDDNLNVDYRFQVDEFGSQWYDKTTKIAEFTQSNNLNLITGDLQMSGQTVIDNSRNITAGTADFTGQVQTTAGNSATSYENAFRVNDNATGSAVRAALTANNTDNGRLSLYNTSSNLRTLIAANELGYTLDAFSIGTDTQSGSAALTVSGDAYISLDLETRDITARDITANSGDPVIAIQNNTENESASGQLVWLESSSAFGTTGSEGFRAKHDGLNNQLIFQSTAGTTIADVLTLNRGGGINTNGGSLTAGAGSFSTVTASASAMEAITATRNSSSVIARFHGNFNANTGEFTGVRMQGQKSDASNNFVDWFFEPNTGKYGFGLGQFGANLPISAGLSFADLIIDNGAVSTNGGSLTAGAGSFTTGSFSGDIIQTGTTNLIRQNTSDGSDNARTILQAGSVASITRGASVQVYGNEYTSNEGNIVLSAGKGLDANGSGKINFLTNGVNRGYVDYDGAWSTNGGSLTAGAITGSSYTGTDLSGTGDDIGYLNSSGKLVRSNIEISKLTSGTYTPTVSNTSNIDSYTVQTFFYQRIGDIVTVDGTINIDVTAAGTIGLDLSLPISSDFTTTYDLTGGITHHEPGNQGVINAIPATDLAGVGAESDGSVGTRWVFNFTYIVQ